MANFPEHFQRQYQLHLNHLKLKGLQPKTIDAYARGVRRIGEYFSYQIDALSEDQLVEYFTDLMVSHSWSAVKLDLYGWKFFTEHVLRKPWAMLNLIRPPKVSRLPDIVSVARSAGAVRCHPRAQLPGGVLHTHNRHLELHPHVHMMMPAAALDTKRKLWRTKARRPKAGASGRKSAQVGGGYLFNHKALAKVFRAKVLDAIEHTGLTLPAALPDTWVVDCNAVGDGRQALLYLGRYLYRGVIQERDILRCDANGNVTFQYRHAKTGKMAVRTLPGADFPLRALHHPRCTSCGRVHRRCFQWPDVLTEPLVPGLSNKRIRSRLRAIYP